MIMQQRHWHRYPQVLNLLLWWAYKLKRESSAGSSAHVPTIPGAGTFYHITFSQISMNSVHLTMQQDCDSCIYLLLLQAATLKRTYAYVYCCCCCSTHTHCSCASKNVHSFCAIYLDITSVAAYLTLPSTALFCHNDKTHAHTFYTPLHAHTKAPASAPSVHVIQSGSEMMAPPTTGPASTAVAATATDPKAHAHAALVIKGECTPT